MSQRFGLNQGTKDSGPYAEVIIPGCGTQTEDNGAILYIEIVDGKPVLYIWGDINQEEPTHKISLQYALESNRDEGISDVGKDENGSG